MRCYLDDSLLNMPPHNLWETCLALWFWLRTSSLKYNVELAAVGGGCVFGKESLMSLVDSIRLLCVTSVSAGFCFCTDDFVLTCETRLGPVFTIYDCGIFVKDLALIASENPA